MQRGGEARGVRLDPAADISLCVSVCGVWVCVYIFVWSVMECSGVRQTACDV